MKDKERLERLERMYSIMAFVITLFIIYISMFLLSDVTTVERCEEFKGTNKELTCKFVTFNVIIVLILWGRIFYEGVRFIIKPTRSPK